MTADTTALMEKLDPARNYGDRSFTTVKKQIKSGALILSEGHMLPQIKDSATGRIVKGSGQKPLAGDTQRATMAVFQSRSLDDIDDFYGYVWDGIKKLDVRAMKLWAEINGLVGNSRDPRAGEMNSALAKLIEAAAGSIPTSVSPTYVDVKASDV